MIARFWGVRGSLPSPGVSTARYGGNTSCVEVELAGTPPLIIDAGTGLRLLGKRLAGEAAAGNGGKAHLLISHTHWDHIHGLPFFSPLFRAGEEVTIYGQRRTQSSLADIVRMQVEDRSCALPLGQVQAKINFEELDPTSQLHIGEATIHCAELNHPWGALGFRISSGEHAIAYVSDTAPFDHILFGQRFIESATLAPLSTLQRQELSRLRDGVLRLCQGADLVIYDTYFTPAEYELRRHWGHSTPEDALAIVREAGARRLVLFHHAPMRTDDQIDGLTEHLQRQADQAANTARAVEVNGKAGPVEVLAAQEGMALDLARGALRCE